MRTKSTMPTRRRALWIAAIVVALGACAGVLGLKSKGRHPFAHGAHVRAGVSCLTCHEPVSRALDTDPVIFPDAAGCVSCHDKPHDTRDCLGCHSDPYAAEAAAMARKHLTFAHATHVPRLNGNCARCHQDVTRGDGPIRPRMAMCLSCHQHDEQYTPEKCGTCHVDLEAEGTPPASHLVHDGDWIREHGLRASSEAAMCASCHSESQCASCHGVTTAAVPSAIKFDVPDGMGLHRAGFRSRHAEEARADPGMCSSCHEESACRACHVDEGVAFEPGALGSVSPHPPGWVGVGPGTNSHGPAARRDPTACAACHSGAGEQLCVDCHKVGGVGGSPHTPAWESDHRDRSTSALPCRLCHI